MLSLPRCEGSVILNVADVLGAAAQCQSRGLLAVIRTLDEAEAGARRAFQACQAWDQTSSDLA